MTTYTYDLMNPNAALVQSGYLSERGQDDRHPLEQMRREELKRLAVDRGYEVTDFHRKEDILLILRSGIRMRAPLPPELPRHSAMAPRSEPDIDVSEDDEAMARASLVSELTNAKFFKLKAVARRYGVDCPAGMTPEQRSALIDDLVERIAGA